MLPKLLLLSSLAALAAASGAQWPCFRRNLNNTGYSPVAGPSSPVAVKWAYNSGGDIHSTTAIDAAGNLYFGSSCNFHAVSPAGSRLWMTSTLRYQITSSPALSPDGSAVYFGSYDHNLYAFGTATGAKLWSVPTLNSVSSSPTVLPSGNVLFGSWNGTLTAVSPSGAVSAVFHTNNSVRCAVAVDSSNNIYLPSWDGYFYKLTSALQPAWPTPLGIGARMQGSPAIGPFGYIYFTGQDNNVYAVDSMSNGVWAFPSNGWIIASPAVGADGTVYIGSMDTNMYALDGSSGNLLWQFTSGNVITSSAVVSSNGLVYFGSWDSVVYALNGTTGALVWNFTTGGAVDASPAIGADGTLYIGSTDGYLYALHTKQSVVVTAPAV